MDAFCQAHPVNKHRLLAGNSAGHYIAFLSAVSKLSIQKKVIVT
jgi:hypothetical protein